jgi:hypothetical protein
VLALVLGVLDLLGLRLVLQDVLVHLFHVVALIQINRGATAAVFIIVIVVA